MVDVAESRHAHDRRAISALALTPAMALSACAGDGGSVTRQQVVVPSLDSHIRMLDNIGEIETVIIANPLPQGPRGMAIRPAMDGTAVFPRLRSPMNAAVRALVAQSSRVGIGAPGIGAGINL